MAFVDINPSYRAILDRHGLTEAAHFLDTAGVIVAGHPGRHVVRLRLGDGPDAIFCYLKKEHRVPWKDRLAGAWAGFGSVSRSCREAAVLKALPGAGVGGPEFIATGEDGRGRAFLLVREVAGAVELRRHLQTPSSPDERRRLAHGLGAALARMHAAGFDHPDLYSKHVLISPGDGGIRFLDWQRSMRRKRVPWRRRVRDLAALHATLADAWASPRERLGCWKAYIMAVRRLASEGAAVGLGVGKREEKRLLRTTLAQAERLLRRRRVRELRQPPLQPEAQSLVWLDGEALCVTPEFLAALQGRVPAWLRLTKRLTGLSRRRVNFAPGRQGELTRRWVFRPLGWLTGRKRPPSELSKVHLIYRLQRYGVPTPRLLAFGYRRTFPGKVGTLLLTEPPGENANFADLLARTGDRSSRWRLARAAGRTLGKVHAAGCRGLRWDRVCVCPKSGAVGLRSVDGLRRGRVGPAAVIRDLAQARQDLPEGAWSRADEMRFLLAYLGLDRLTRGAKETARHVLRKSRGRRDG